MYDVITIGAATRDSFVQSKDFSIVEGGQYLTGRAECLPLGAKIEVREIQFFTGGGATNSAVSFARKRLWTATILRVGNDAGGKQVIEDLAKEGVVTRFVQETSHQGTGYAIALIAMNGERSELVYRGAGSHISHQEIDWPECQTKWFYVTSLAGNVELMSEIVNFAHHHKAKVAWNPGARELHHGLKKLAYLLKHVAVLILNQEEAALLTGLPFEETTKIFLALEAHGPKIILMTRGPEGALVTDGQYLFNAGIFQERERVDRTGAGDAFGSGFVAGLILDGSIPEALRIAAANATSKIEHVGAHQGLLTLKQLSEKRWEHLPVSRRAL